MNHLNKIQPGFAILIFASCLLFGCDTKKSITDKAGLNVFEMAAVTQLKKQINAEMVETALDIDPLYRQYIRIAFVNSVISDNDTALAKNAATELMTKILVNSEQGPHFDGYEIRFVTKQKTWLGLREDIKYAMVYFTKEDLAQLGNSLGTDIQRVSPVISEAFESKDYLRAIYVCDSLILAGHNAVVAQVVKGHAYILMGDTANALLQVDRVIKLDDTSVYALNNLANLLGSLNQRERQKKLLNKSIERDSTAAETWYAIACVARDENRYEDACAFFKKASGMGYNIDFFDTLNCN